MHHWSRRYAGLRCECGHRVDPYRHRNAIRELLKNGLVQLGPWFTDWYKSGNYVEFRPNESGLDFLGRPPFLPLIREAAALRGLRMEPTQAGQKAVSCIL